MKIYKNKNAQVYLGISFEYYFLINIHFWVKGFLPSQNSA